MLDQPPLDGAACGALARAIAADEDRWRPHVRFDEGSRARLARHAPRGKVFDLKLEWTASAAELSALQKWTVSSRFEGLTTARTTRPVAGTSGNG